jgi:Predicted glutathione S-transferase
VGILVEGRWTDADDAVIKGRFVRPDSAYGSPLAGICESLQSEPGRYHLVASLSCPWSQRALIVHGLKDLRGCVPVHIIGGGRTQGYALDDSPDWRLPGSDAQSRHLHELYSVTDRTYSGRATVPVLWDSHASRIVSNESAQIIRAFDAAGAHQDGAFTLVPLAMRDDIDALNTYVQEHLCDAVYRAGFAQRQDAYEEAVDSVFATLDLLEQHLGQQRYLFGQTITEADWRLFPTLARFDAVYHGHFKCARRRLIDMPVLWAYARDLFAWRGVAATVDLPIIRAGYYRHDLGINPFGIVPVADEADWTASHDRARLGPAKVALVSGGEREIDPATLRQHTERRTR